MTKDIEQINKFEIKNSKNLKNISYFQEKHNTINEDEFKKNRINLKIKESQTSLIQINSRTKTAIGLSNNETNMNNKEDCYELDKVNKQENNCKGISLNKKKKPMIRKLLPFRVSTNSINNDSILSSKTHLTYRHLKLRPSFTSMKIRSNLKNINNINNKKIYRQKTTANINKNTLKDKFDYIGDSDHNNYDYIISDSDGTKISLRNKNIKYKKINSLCSSESSEYPFIKKYGK